MPTKARPNWAAVKREYLESDLTLRQIAAKHGITTTSILNRREAGDWPKRSETRVHGARFGQNVAPPAAPTKVELAERLMKTIDRKLKQMEKRMTKGDGSDASPAESERDARALANLTRALDQASEMIAGERGSEGAGGLETTNDDKAGDALRLRRELAERIARLGKRTDG